MVPIYILAEALQEPILGSALLRWQTPACPLTVRVAWSEWGFERPLETASSSSLIDHYRRTLAKTIIQIRCVINFEMPSQ